MDIVQCSGGLGNQMCDYIFMRYLEIKMNKEAFMDNHSFDFKKEHNGFELDKIFPNIKLNLLKNEMHNDWKEVIKSKGGLKNGICMANIIKDYKIPIDTLVTTNTFNKNSAELNSFNGKRLIYENHIFLDLKYPQGLNEVDNCYYICKCYTDIYFKEIKSTIINEFKFKPIEDDMNKYYFKLIKETFSIGVHIRRGDMVDLGLSLESHNYFKAISTIRKRSVDNCKNPIFFVFSDDIKYCKDNYFEMGFKITDEVVYVEGNKISAKNYIDMQLMSNCKCLVYSPQSSFAKLSEWLNLELVDTIKISKK